MASREVQCESKDPFAYTRANLACEACWAKAETRRHRQAQSISRLTHCPSVQHPIHRSLPHYSPRVRGFGGGRPVAGERAHRRGLGAAGGVSTSAEGRVARRQELRSTGGGTLGDHCGTAGGRRRSTCCGLRSATASVPGECILDLLIKRLWFGG